MSTRPLAAGEKNMLRLVVKGRRDDGWTPVSAAVYPVLAQVPRELIELEEVGSQGQGRVRLTREGQSVVDAMAWLGSGR